MSRILSAATALGRSILKLAFFKVHRKPRYSSACVWVITCPECLRSALVQADKPRQFTGPSIDLCIHACTLWPQHKNCARACLEVIVSNSGERFAGMRPAKHGG